VHQKKRVKATEEIYIKKEIYIINRQCTTFNRKQVYLVLFKYQVHSMFIKRKRYNEQLQMKYAVSVFIKGKTVLLCVGSRY
jgi:hypothetical protein